MPGAIVTCLGFMLLVSDCLPLAGFALVVWFSVDASGYNSRFLGIGVSLVGALGGWNKLNVRGVSLYGPACIIRTVPCKFFLSSAP